MSESNIEWTDATWNPTVGCSKVSEGCRNCYAMTMARRIAAMAGADVEAGRVPPEGKRVYTDVVKYKDGHPLPQWNGRVVCRPDALDAPLRWRKPRRVFVNSMSDLFHEGVPFEFVDRVFAVMALCPHHTFQVLTKRPERMREYMELCASGRGPIWDAARELGQSTDHLKSLRPWPLSNVWLGTSVEDQAAAEARIPHLLRCPASVRFLSCEPLLGAVDFSRVGVRKTRIGESNRIDWVIVGGESGAGARSCDLAWIRGIVSQCRDAGVACFVKQLGANPSATLAETGTDETDDDNIERLELRDRKGGDPDEWPEDLVVREWPGGKASGIGH